MNVDLAANASAQYSSVLVTVKEVWFNENATASPDDASWVKFPLSEPETLQLVGVDDAAMSELASRLKVAPGTYAQIRLLLVDRTETLTASAAQAGATYNDQVTYVDASGVETTLPLELPAAAQGVGIATDLVVPVAKRAVLAALAAASNASTPSSLATATPSASTSVGATTSTPVGAAMPTAGVPAETVPAPSASTPSPSQTAETTSSSSDAAAATVTTTVLFDATHDLTMFRFADRPGFLLNPSLSAYDADAAGYIVGQLDVSAIAPNPGTGRPDAEVAAETLNGDSTRRVEVASAPVRADGTFTLYPLPVPTGTNDAATTYDLVIHGPAITTTVVRAVPVTKGAPDASSTAAFGTVTLLAADTYRANLAAGSEVAPRGARVQFYQTLPDDAAPFVIAERAVDPLTGRLAADEPLSAAPDVVYGTFGASFSLAAAAPTEGAARYSLAASAPLYGSGELSPATIAPPAAGATAAFTVPAIPVPPDAAPGTIAASVAAAPGKYDDGALLVTHDGAIVAAAPLSAVLSDSQASTVVSVANLPAGGSSGYDRGLYYLEAWAWSSANPASSFTRQPVSGAVDLRAVNTASVTVDLN